MHFVNDKEPHVHTLLEKKKRRIESGMQLNVKKHFPLGRNMRGERASSKLAEERK